MRAALNIGIIITNARLKFTLSTGAARYFPLPDSQCWLGWIGLSSDWPSIYILRYMGLKKALNIQCCESIDMSDKMKREIKEELEKLQTAISQDIKDLEEVAD